MTTTDLPADAPLPAYSMAAEAPPQPSSRLGIVAMILGLGVFVLSLTSSLLMGVAAAPYAQSGPNGFSVNLMLDPSDPTETTLFLLAVTHMALGTAFGLWALVQGIVAIATRRGRAQGIVAVVAAFLAPGISAVVYAVVAISGATG